MNKITKTISLVAVFVAVGFLSQCANDWLNGKWQGAVNGDVGGTIEFKDDDTYTAEVNGVTITGKFKYTKKKTEKEAEAKAAEEKKDDKKGETEIGKFTFDEKECQSTYSEGTLVISNCDDESKIQFVRAKK